MWQMGLRGPRGEVPGGGPSLPGPGLGSAELGPALVGEGLLVSAL